VRDNNGRIYVDLKEEWMRPLIDYLKYNEAGEDPISPCSLYLCRSIQLFNENGEFSFPDPTFSIHGYSVSSRGTKILPSMIFNCKLQNSY
jgi:hypothetical protein